VILLRESIDDIRKRIEKIDYEILRMMANRTAAAVEMGRMKANESMPLRAPAVEERVIGRYIDKAKDFGMSASSARQIARLLIRESIEQQGHIPRPSLSKRVFIIGGSGKMGRWLADLLESRGHRIRIYDVVESDKFPMERDLARGVREAEVVIIATPISATRGMLKKVIELKPEGLVFDIASVKNPFQDLLQNGVENGLILCSLHPMFGPDAYSIIDRNIVICNCGSTDAVDRASALMDGANIMEIELEEHDPIMAYVLGLSHATNIAFFESLRASGMSFENLSRAASTTFRKQVDTARDVASENSQLYYEIQRMNPHNANALASLQKALEEIRIASERDSQDMFKHMMNEGKNYFGGNQ